MSTSDRHTRPDPVTTAGPWARPPGSPPSPRPRPVPPPAPSAGIVDAGQPTGPSPTDPVTLGNSPLVSTGDSGSPWAPGGDSAGGPESLQSPVDSPPDSVTLGERLRVWLVAVKAYVTPPRVLTDPPPSIAELRGYARWGAWTASTGAVRKLGIVWHRLVSLPVTVVCRYVEWLWQRPGRLIPVFVLWKLLILTGPGPWAADHLIRPVLGLAAWVLL